MGSVCSPAEGDTKTTVRRNCKEASGNSINGFPRDLSIATLLLPSLAGQACTFWIQDDAWISSLVFSLMRNNKSMYIVRQSWSLYQQARSAVYGDRSAFDYRFPQKPCHGPRGWPQGTAEFKRWTDHTKWRPSRRCSVYFFCDHGVPRIARETTGHIPEIKTSSRCLD